MEPLETPERALIFTPHPDDAEGGCGGTVVKWVNEGAEVFLVLATDGRAGTSDPSVSPEDLIETREREQAEAAKAMGVKEVVNLRNPDGGLEDTREFRGQLVEAIRRFKPDVVLTTEPYHRLSHGHRDHRTIGIVAQDACFPLRPRHPPLPGTRGRRPGTPQGRRNPLLGVRGPRRLLRRQRHGGPED